MEEPHFQPARHTERLFRDQNREYSFDREDDRDFDTWQSAFRAELREALGLAQRMESEPPGLDSQRLDTEQLYGYERQKWVVRTEPGIRVPFYLLLPTDLSPPYPVVFAVHGHGHTGKELYAGRFETEDQREKIEAGERDIGVQAVQRGYAAIVPDMRGFGELSAVEDYRNESGSCRTMQMHAQLFGRTLVGDRAWDVHRLIDFVEDHADLDDERIVITGNSGGGTVSLFAAAVDERIQVSVPASAFCSFEDSIGSLYHCECNYVPGILSLGELWDVAGLVAPRPFLAIHGQEDPIFPIEATRRAFERLQEIYDAAEVSGNCDLYVGNRGHRYYKDGAWPFIDEHL